MLAELYLFLRTFVVRVHDLLGCEFAPVFLLLAGPDDRESAFAQHALLPIAFRDSIPVFFEALL